MSSAPAPPSGDGNNLVLLAQGAEARVFELPAFLGGRPAIVKERFAKTYRLPVLDAKLTRQRTVQEVRCMLRCATAGVHVPCVYLVDAAASRIYMEKIEGRTLKEFLRTHYDEASAQYTTAAQALARRLGVAVARIHDAEMVHGDLTTSNFLVVGGHTGGKEEEGGGKPPPALVAIDFGLGFLQPLPEDKAVDLYVLERAFISTHPHSRGLVDEVMAGYQESSPPHRSTGVLKKLEDVRRRGRKRDMFG